LGLVVFGIIVLTVILVGPRNVSDVANWSSIAAIIALLQGSVILIGARQMRKLEAYQFVVLTCLVAMLPCSPAILIGLPMGIWALIALRSPEIKAAFHGGYPEAKALSGPRSKGRLRRLFGTTTWATLFSFVGCLLTFLPWSELRVQGRDTLVTLTSVNGYETAFGMMTTFVFLILLFLLLATGFMEPIPAWRPWSLLAAGILVSLLAAISGGTGAFWEQGSTGPGELLGHFQEKGFSVGLAVHADGSFEYQESGRTVSFARPDSVRIDKVKVLLPGEMASLTWNHIRSPVKVSIREGAYIAILLAFALLCLGTLQLREVLRRGRQNNVA
jgi:hypothetical protein